MIITVIVTVTIILNKYFWSHRVTLPEPVVGNTTAPPPPPGPPPVRHSGQHFFLTAASPTDRREFSVNFLPTPHFKNPTHIFISRFIEPPPSPLHRPPPHKPHASAESPHERRNNGILRSPFSSNALVQSTVD